MRLLRAVGIALLVGLLASCGLAGDARVVAGPVTLLQANICGNACSSGGPNVVRELVGTIDESRPWAVTLNEVCENQFVELRAGLEPYQGRFDPTGPLCRNGARYGNALFVRTTELNTVGSWTLPNPGGEEYRRLLCARAAGTTVCVTHLSVDTANIAPQVDAIATVLGGLSGPVVFAGDLNTNPSDARLDPLYRDFDEVDSGGADGDRAVLNSSSGPDVLNEDTYDRHKFDYIFLSNGSWSTPEADASDAVNGRSDHDALWATVVVNPDAADKSA